MRDFFIKQQNQMDCGSTCLYMISKWHGRSFSIEKLRELTEIGKEGVNLLGISDAAEKIDFEYCFTMNGFNISTCE